MQWHCRDCHTHFQTPPAGYLLSLLDNKLPGHCLLIHPDASWATHGHQHGQEQWASYRGHPAVLPMPPPSPSGGFSYHNSARTPPPSQTHFSSKSSHSPHELSRVPYSLRTTYEDAFNEYSPSVDGKVTKLPTKTVVGNLKT